MSQGREDTHTKPHSTGTKPRRESETDQFLELLTRVQGSQYDNQRYIIKPGGSPRAERDRRENSTSNNSEVDQEDLMDGKASPVSGREGSISSSNASETVASTPSRRSMAALKELLMKEGPYPLLMEPPDGGYRFEMGDYTSALGDDGVWRAQDISTEHYQLEKDNACHAYGKFFYKKEHRNYIANDSKAGPLLLSIRCEDDYTGRNIRMILRTQTETVHRVVPCSQLSEDLDPEDYIKYISKFTDHGEMNQIGKVVRVIYPKAPELVKKYDEHTVVATHKFGILLQKFGQTSEEELFGNVHHTTPFEEFLELLGNKVPLKGFQGYRGGLDVSNNQTGEHSIYTEYKDREIMFHVSTLLPHDDTDTQQVQRKRHIGNDIVVVVFQEENTPFCPNTIRTHFVHSYIVVQVEHPNTDHTIYKVAVASKNDVPHFGPPLPDPSVFPKGPEFRDWLLTKLLNAEYNCHKAPDFQKLEVRTRTQLFIQTLQTIVGCMDDAEGSKNSMSLLSTDTQFLSASLNSPQRRRKTLGGLFSRESIIPSFKRKSVSNLSPRSYRKQMTPDSSGPSFIGSTPDLAVVEDVHRESPRLITMNSVDEQPQSPEESAENDKRRKSKTKRFTLRKDKKSKRSSSDASTEAAKFFGMSESGKKRKSTSPSPHTGGLDGLRESSCESSVASGLNWSSIPSDLPSLAAQQANETSNPASINNLSYASLPGAILEIEERSVDRDRAPPTKVDVGTQVDSKERMFVFPPFPQTAPPAIDVSKPSDSSSVSSSSSSKKIRRLSTPIRKLPSPRDIENRYSNLRGSATTYTQMMHIKEKRENQSRGHARSFSEVEKRFVVPQTSSSPVLFSTGVWEPFSDEEGGIQTAESTDSIPSEADEAYGSLLQSLQAMTVEMARLREQNIKLLRENAKFASQNRRLKAKYNEAKLQLSQQAHDQRKLELQQPEFV